MQEFSVDQFNLYIKNNRFIVGKEIAWFKSELNSVERVGVIIECEVGFESVLYERKNSAFALHKFQKFTCEQDALDFVRNEIEK
jgi:hypothetical protein